jgi:hypothetical protein
MLQMSSRAVRYHLRNDQYEKGQNMLLHFFELLDEEKRSGRWKHALFERLLIEFSCITDVYLRTKVPGVRR